MGITISERSALEELAAARLQEVDPETLLQLADAVIDQAAAAGDTLTLESVAAELDSAAAPLQPDQGDGLRLRLAARRARATSQIVTAVAASEEGPVPAAAKVAFWGTVAVAALTLFLVAVIAGQGDDSGYGVALVLIAVVGLGSLFLVLTGVVGLVESVRAGSGKGVLMSAVPCAIAFLLILARIAVAF